MFDTLHRAAYHTTKRCLDIVGSTAGLAATAPLWASAAAAIRLTMGRPVLFRQTRPGKDGRPFEMLKFRTMRTPRPGEDLVGSDADRITAVGHWLRQTSIDELPTLINVLKGDMSLVGPRPLLMRYLDRYTPEQARRHQVKPGVTGHAQVNGRNALSWDQKFAHDLWYVDHQSLGVDLTILAVTVAKVLRRDGIAAAGEATIQEFVGTENCAASL